MELTFDITPCPAPRMTRSDKWKKRDCVVKYFHFRDTFRKMCMMKKYKLSDTLDIKFFIPMPESWSKKKRTEMNGKPHQSRPDVDNIVKGICDSFGIDDGFVWDIHARKYWSEKGSIKITINEPVCARCSKPLGWNVLSGYCSLYCSEKAFESEQGTTFKLG